MDLGLKGRTALVCGASKGLGYACAEALAREGVEVTLVARDAKTLANAAERLSQSVGCAAPAFVAADLATSAGRAALLEKTGAPDILVTNCGGPPSKDFRELSAADWDGALQGNFLSAADLIKGVADAMIAREFGRIVNITSLTVRMPVQKLDLSTAPRLALSGFVAGVARQLAPHNVTINNLLPGTIMTERIEALGATAQALIDKVPAGRAGAPEEFAAACAFLCSAQAGYITAQNLLVDGGLCPFTV